MLKIHEVQKQWPHYLKCNDHPALWLTKDSQVSLQRCHWKQTCRVPPYMPRSWNVRDSSKMYRVDRSYQSALSAGNEYYTLGKDVVVSLQTQLYVQEWQVLTALSHLFLYNFSMPLFSSKILSQALNILSDFKNNEILKNKLFWGPFCFLSFSVPVSNFSLPPEGLWQ